MGQKKDIRLKKKQYIVKTLIKDRKVTILLLLSFRATLDEPDGQARVWVFYGNSQPTRVRGQ